MYQDDQFIRPSDSLEQPEQVQYFNNQGYIAHTLTSNPSVGNENSLEMFNSKETTQQQPVHRISEISGVNDLVGGYNGTDFDEDYLDGNQKRF